MTVSVHLFCEDSAQESTGRTLIGRAAQDAGWIPVIRAVSARGGIPRMLHELRSFQAVLAASSGLPDLLVVMIDGNAEGPAARRRRVEEVIDERVFPRVVIAVPDPTVEAWLLCEPGVFRRRFGVAAPTARGLTGAQLKERLVQVLEDAGEIVTQGGSEFADEIFDEMDFARAERQTPTLASFMGDLRAAFRQVAIADRA